jgi:hypothetical protein
MSSERLNHSLGESKRIFNQLAAQASAVSGSTSSTLFGMLGGFVGIGMAYGVALYTSASLALLSPIMGGAGVVVGVLLYRGRDRCKFESRLEMYQRSLEIIRTEIRLLPKNAPETTRDALWHSYTRLISSPPISSERILAASAASGTQLPSAQDAP